MTGPTRVGDWVRGTAGVLAAGLIAAFAGTRAAEPPPRPAWTTSHVRGTPEPPPPYRIVRAWPKLEFKSPTHLTGAPGSDRFFVTELGGKVYSFRQDDPQVAKPDLFLDLPAEVASVKPGPQIKEWGGLYSMTFHPDFAKNRYCYVCYMAVNREKKKLCAIERLARFTVSTADPPRADPASELIIMEWPTEPGGHNGGCLNFGPDGFLYVSMGDGADPSPPDSYDTGQDLSDLFSSILRIDVNRKDGDKPYAVPADNPFVTTPKARPEIWAYGLRNPWKMQFDPATGDLWVGDVGWELWEMIYRIQKGGNYGWSVMEGPQAVRPNAKRGPTPILPPALSFPHTEAASITGGPVYHGKRQPALEGAYLCGDWMTGKVWGTKFDGERVVWHKELAQSRHKIIVFGTDRQGEPYYLDYDETGHGGIYTIEPTPSGQDLSAQFPRKLSATGLFADTARHQPAPGVLPYEINAAQWADYAVGERLIGLPDLTTVKVYDQRTKVPGTAFYEARDFYPPGAVLARTWSMELERGQPETRRRLETQILHFDGEDWHGYTYRWNDAQTDADLVGPTGGELPLTVKDAKAPGGVRQQTWRFHGRGECRQCHNPWAGNVLGFTTPQLDRGEQLALFRQQGILTPVDEGGKPKPADVPVKPYARMTEPARSYLHANCSHCHQPGAGGTARLDLRFDTTLKEMNVFDKPPMQGDFGLPDGKLLAYVDPFRSVIFYRMAKVGPGRMPHIGSAEVDLAGLQLVEDWIRVQDGGKTNSGVPVGAGRDDLIQRVNDIQEPPGQRLEIIQRCLSTTDRALCLMRLLDRGQVKPEVRKEVIAAAMASPDSRIRDLFERFTPADQRVKRLGPTVVPDTILKLPGNAARGRTVFFMEGGPRCVACHRVSGTGGTLGPDLSQIGKKYTRAQILESILEPSKTIDQQYVAYTVQTSDGKLYTGLLASKNAKEVVLRDAEDKEIRLPADQVEGMKPSKTSLMPEQLLRDLTAQQAADLVEFLAGLK